MKKILVLLLLYVFGLPILAACKLDEPCVVNVLDDSSQVKTYNSGKVLSNDNLKTEVFKDKTDLTPKMNTNIENPNYNANCQFGVCLPERSFTEIIDVTD